MSSNKPLPVENVPSVPMKAGEQKTESGLEFTRHFTKKGSNPYDEIEWEKREILLTNEDGDVIFQQKDVEVPKSCRRQLQT
jgi:ribonucleoside-diphosphate reductase alpha chain